LFGISTNSLSTNHAGATNLPSCPLSRLAFNCAVALAISWVGTVSGAIAAPGDEELAKQAREFVKQGMADYKAGDYANAAGHLGAALSSDFNNPLLHYYLGNSYVQLKQKDGAIREFRIAYALQPTGEVGNYARRALLGLGTDVTANEAATSDFKVDKSAFSSPILDRAKSALQEQAEKEKAARNGVWQGNNDSTAKRDAEALKRTKQDMLDNSPHNYSRRFGTPYPVNLSKDSQQQLDSIKHTSDAQRKKAADSGAQQANEIERSAQNLQGLLNDKPKPGEAKLVPNGTNLFIRNYEPVSPQTQPTTSTQPSTSTSR
jgi:tetratricopeptide (TPR) repeat protein